MKWVSTVLPRKKIGEPVVNTEAVAKTVAGKSVGAAAAGGCASSGSVGWLVFLLLLPLAAIRIGRVRAFATVAVIASLFVFALSACSDSGSSGCESNADCGIGQRCVNGACQDVSDGDISGGDMDLPDGDIEKEVAPDGDKDTADGDVEEDDQVIEVPCESHDECPECHYCSKKDKVCKVQACDPECANADLNIPSCIDTMGDSCALCDTEEAIHLCYIPRCTDDNWEDLCSCRTCENGKPPVACRVATGECYCPDDWCQGGCMEGSYCCTPPAELSVDPAGSCVHCPDWCEGILCEPGFAPGGCDPTEDDCGFEWAPCDNIDPATCMAVGEGSPDDPNCECQEMPPLPIGQHGRFNDVEFYTITDDREVVDHLIWVATYNDTYGDLMVGTTYYFQMPPSGAVPEENYHWAFIDGVPSLEEEGVEIEAGPSGPRGGIAEPGPNVGMHTSMMLSADGWPRIAYTDVDNGDLLFIYTDGELAEGVELEEGAEIDPKNYVWHKIIVDADGTTGYYTDMLLDENGYPVITYMTLEIGSSKTSQLKVAMASSASPTSADDFSFVVVDSAPVPGTACGGTCDLENNKCFYQGGQDVCAPETEDCDPGCGDGQVCYNGGCYSERVESSGVKLLPEGVGLNPSTGFYSDGSLWISYYHNSTYSGGEILRRGYLKLAKSNSKPTHSNLAGMGFGKEILAGNEGSLSYGDCGLFSSLAIEPNTGWYAVSFINRLKNELQVIYDLGEGRHMHIADSGWREDGLYTKRFKVGADSQLTINHVGAFVIVYQDQSNSKLNYYSEKCYSDGTCDSNDASFIEVLGMEEGEFGRSYGYYPSLKFIANGVPILSSYGVELLPEEKIYLILQKI